MYSLHFSWLIIVNISQFSCLCNYKTIWGKIYIIWNEWTNLQAKSFVCRYFCEIIIETLYITRHRCFGELTSLMHERWLTGHVYNVDELTTVEKDMSSDQSSVCCCLVWCDRLDKERIEPSNRLNDRISHLARSPFVSSGSGISHYCIYTSDVHTGRTHRYVYMLKTAIIPYSTTP